MDHGDVLEGFFRRISSEKGLNLEYMYNKVCYVQLISFIVLIED